MKIVVTGGSGFIGKPVIRILLKKGHSVMALSRSAEEYNKINKVENLQWINTSLELDETNLQLIKDFAPEAIIHLAWEKIPDFSFETSLHNLENQVTFFKHICQLASVKKIIVAGSCFEYNQSFGECLESNICTPTNYFTWAKNAVREFLQVECLQKQINLVWARIFYVYGPGQRSASLIPVIIKNLQDGKVPDLRKPANANDFVYVDDVAEGLNQILEKEIPSGIYNLGGGRSTPVIDVLRMIDQQINNSDTIAGQVLANAGNPVKEIDAWANMQKTHSALNWQASVSMKEGIKKMINSIV
jgi:nucleoside-diphosphate-sugar epimerase